MLETWITRIESASPEELEEIRHEWSAHGRNYKSTDWVDFWQAFTARKLELGGIKPTDPAF